MFFDELTDSMIDEASSGYLLKPGIWEWEIL